MTLDQLEEAAFWERLICLDCEAQIDKEAEYVQSCLECGSEQLLPATTAKKLVELIDRGEE